MTKVIGNWWNSEEVRNSRRALVLILASFILVWFYKYGKDNVSIRNDGYLLNIHTEVFGVALGAVVTIFVIDRLYERQRKQNLIDRLLYDARSTEPAVSKRAFEDMKYHRLIYGENSILRRGKRRANLYGACSGRVTLSRARMDGAIMTWSDFSESEFDRAILDNACLGSANLEWASFRDASLKDANLENADLSHATLVGADLTGANLLGAKIYRDKLYNYAAELPDVPDTETPQATLPDGTPITANTDMARFTNPEHPKFWRSDDPESPAFRGHYEERLARIKRMSENRPSNLPPPPTPPAGGDSG